jgi:hypothetical protein
VEGGCRFGGRPLAFRPHSPDGTIALLDARSRDIPAKRAVLESTAGGPPPIGRKSAVRAILWLLCAIALVACGAGQRGPFAYDDSVWVPESRSGVIMIARTWSAQCWPRKTIVTGSFCQPRAGVWVSRA